jgi:Ca2+-binding EF-hand superfamily protein
MKSDKFDIFYVLANVFRYDQNSDGFITYDEMADFFLEMHNGELALMRLHRNNTYERGHEQLMNLKEFMLTLENSFAYIEVVPTKQELTVLFSEIDLDKDGWISYKTYFEFLRVYFGSKSEVSTETRRDNEFKVLVKKHSSLKLSPEQRFVRMIMREMKYLLDDYNPFQLYDENIIRLFLKNIFELTEDEIDYVMRNFFRSLVGSSGLFMEMEIAGIFLEILFAEIALMRMHKKKKFLRWKDRLINLEEFL